MSVTYKYNVNSHIYMYTAHIVQALTKDYIFKVFSFHVPQKSPCTPQITAMFVWESSAIFGVLEHIEVRGYNDKAI